MRTEQEMYDLILKVAKEDERSLHRRFADEPECTPGYFSGL